MPAGLVIDGGMVSGETVSPAVSCRAGVMVPNGLGRNLPLFGAVCLHLAVLLVALTAPRLGVMREQPPKAYSVQLYTVAEVAEVSAPAQLRKPLPAPVVARRVAAQPRPEVTGYTLAPAAPVAVEAVALTVAPVAIAPMALVAVSIPAPSQVAEAGAPVSTVAALPASQGLAFASGGGTTALAGRAVAEAAEPEVAPVVLAHPLYRENPLPEYPPLARRRQLEGTVVLKVQVSAEGKVSGLVLHESSGHALLDEAALKAVRGWRFEPGRRGAMAVAMQVLAPVRFGLH